LPKGDISILLPQTELVDANGRHIRYVPGEMARAMVAGRHAEIAHQNGKVRSIRLVTAATSHAQMIGPPTDSWLAPRFPRRVRSDDQRTHVVGASSAMPCL
jgi:hypothetical protein